MDGLGELALGGTAVGTGLNAHKDFGTKSAEYDIIYDRLRRFSPQTFFVALAAVPSTIVRGTMNHRLCR